MSADAFLKDLSPEDQAKLELADSFEIELGPKTYYTILDMEDGNYISLDDEGKVFRLHQDSRQPVKETSPSIEAFLKGYSGDKDKLAYLFD